MPKKVGGRPVRRQQHRESRLKNKGPDTLFLEHLRSMGYKYSLSVFLPESGVNTAPPLSKLEILQVLNIRKATRYTARGTLGELSHHFWTGARNRQNGGQLISAILEGLESGSTLHDSFTQTDDGNSPSERLLKRLDDVDYAFRQQQRAQAVGEGTAASVEDN